MCAFITLIQDLTPATITATIKVRCIRTYRVSYHAKNKEMASMEAIFHDRNGVRIHLSFPAKVVHTSTLKLKEGSIYMIRNFLIKPNHMRVKTATNDYKLNGYTKTEVVEVFHDTFPTNFFNFKSFEEVQAIANLMEEPLFDVIGVVKQHGAVANEKNGKLLELELEDEHHNTLFCTIWEEHVSEYIKQIDDKQKKIPIAIIQFCRPSLFKGSVRINTSYNISKIALNTDCPEVSDFRSRIFGDESFIPTLPTALTVPKLKPKTEFESNELMMQNISDLFGLEDGMYWVCARIESVGCFGDWYYLSCIRCSKKVMKCKSQFYCGRCKKYDGKTNQRFMLKLDLFDGTSSADFLLWDRECSSLIGKKVGEIKYEAGEVGVPNEIESILIGQILLFKVLLRTEATFSENSPYNINMICDDSDIVSKYSATNLDKIDSVVKAKNDDNVFFDECSSLSPIVNLGSHHETLKLQDEKLMTPKAIKIGFSVADEWRDDDDGQKNMCGKISHVKKSKGQYVVDLDGDDDTIPLKRKLDDEFQICGDSSKKRGIVKLEKKE